MTQAAEILLAQRYARPAVVRILATTRYRDDVDDVLQRAAVKMLTTKSKFKGESSFRTWFYKIAVNEALYLRRDTRTQRTEDIGERVFTCKLKRPDQLAIEGERAARLHAAIELLPPTLQAGAYDALHEVACANTDGTRKARRFRAKLKLHEALRGRV